MVTVTHRLVMDVVLSESHRNVLHDVCITISCWHQAETYMVNGQSLMVSWEQYKQAVMLVITNMCMSLILEYILMQSLSG